jgi:hypothetical protein
MENTGRLTSWNHYVPQMHLKRFASGPGIINEYSLLVSHERVRRWKQCAIKSAGAHEHLYTRTHEDELSDEIERWFTKEFETPAVDAYELAVTGGHLERQHWINLVRFWAAQQARTPAAYISDMKNWRATEQMVHAELQQAIQEAQDHYAVTGRLPDVAKVDLTDCYPLRVERMPSADPQKSAIRVKVAAGRAFWLASVRNRLKDGGPLSLLESYEWTILTMPKGLQLFTSDNPAVIYRGEGDGLGSLGPPIGLPGTLLLMPLTPTSLLYTQVAGYVPKRGTELSETEALFIRKILAWNSYRSIFSDREDSGVVDFRPRLVDAAQFEKEKSGWQSWHANHTAADSFGLENEY